MRIVSIVGARPNFMKLAPLHRALLGRGGVDHAVVHTGQHYDYQMSAAFFTDLGIPEPDINLAVGSASPVQQIGTIMLKLEPVFSERRPDLILVYGDVNSTLAAALVAAKAGIAVGHVEAGLRSRDWTMPEELNRVLTDRLAQFLFTPSRDADENLLAEGIPRERIHFVGNIMIDALVHALPQAIAAGAARRRGVGPGEYVLVTLHRPSNVDQPETLASLVKALDALSADRPVVFPVHPRTRSRMDALGLRPVGNGKLKLLEPVGYIEMLSLVADAGLVITDSGGLQEETSYLGVPCVTVRPNTERPVTVTHGTNCLVPSVTGLLAAVEKGWRTARRPCGIELWDGKTAERIAAAICL